MAGSIACILSYGLLCAPAEVEVVEPPPPAPLTPADADDPAVESAGEDGDAPEASAPEGSASYVLAQVQSYYDATKDLQAEFTQTYTHAVYGTKKVSKGTLKVRKPGKMVWDYAEADNADFYVDGSKVWVVERPTKQVITKDVGKSDIAGAEKFLFGGKQLVSDFMVKLAGESLEKRYGKKGHTAIRLKPRKKNPHYRELLLVVDDDTGRVDAFVVLNQDDSINYFDLGSVKRNTGMPVGAVTFKKPAGFKTISG